MNKAMLLTAGKGKRLLPLTRHYPKPLFPVGDRPCLTYLIELLRDRGFRELILNLHHLGDVIADYLGNGEAFGVRISYSREEKLLGTGGGVRKAFSLLDPGENLLVLNGDILTDSDPTRLVRLQQAKNPIATMGLRARPADSPYTVVRLGTKSLVSGIGGEDPGPSYFFPGIQLLTPAFVENLSGPSPLCLVADGYLPALQKGLPVAGLPQAGYWREIGTLSSYWSANLDFLRGKSPAYFYRGREDFTRRGIHAGKRAQLGQRISFRDPVYLGDDCAVGNGCVLGPNVLVGSGCRVGDDCRLENVLLWPETTVRKNSRISNTIVTPFGRLELPAP